MNKLTYHEKKTLKLTNVLKYQVLLQDESFNIPVCVEQMQSYIRMKGATQIGPLIQYTKTFLNENQELDLEIYLMLQCNNYIHNVEQPYTMEPDIRVPDAMYCKYNGDEAHLRLAYEKINIEAFERDETLDNCNYTIFLSSNEEENCVTADIIVPRVVF